jgi:hypothetical protein
MRRTALLVAPAVALALAGGCSYFYSGGTRHPLAGRSVYVIGDSNVAAAGPELISTLGPRYDAFVHGRGGSTTQLALGTQKSWSKLVQRDLRTKLPSRLAAAVVHLGTNDCARAAIPAIGGVPTAIDRIMGAIPRSTPVLWDNVVPVNWYCAVVNASIVQAAARWPNLIVTDYAGRIGTRPDLMVAGSPHMSPAGRGAYARWVSKNIRHVAP